MYATGLQLARFVFWQEFVVNVTMHMPLISKSTLVKGNSCVLGVVRCPGRQSLPLRWEGGWSRKPVGQSAWSSASFRCYVRASSESWWDARRLGTGRETHHQVLHMKNIPIRASWTRSFPTSTTLYLCLAEALYGIATSSVGQVSRRLLLDRDVVLSKEMNLNGVPYIPR